MKLFLSIILFFALGVMSYPLNAQKENSNVASSKNDNSSNGNGAGKHLFIDVHHLGPGKVTYDAVAGAHAKDLATEGKYGVDFIKYWVNEKDGVVICLSEAPDSSAVIKTHKEAHGLIPKYVLEVKQGQ